MDVRKCDRCGEHYSVFLETGPTGIYLVRYVNESGNHIINERYHICPTCIREFENFMKKESM